jgi:poly-beta-1,6-N-acetyl-D-glucosamine synthase
MSVGSLRSARRLAIGLCVYVQLGYPVIVAAAARSRSTPSSLPATRLPKVTVLIAAWNEEAVIRAKLENTLESDYPPDLLEVVVATDGSTDATPKLVAGFGDHRVVLSHSDRRDGKAAAIDRAIPVATGEIIVLSDANNMYSPLTVRRLAERFVDPLVGAVSGAKTTTSGPADVALGESLYWRYENNIKRGEDRLASCTSASGEVLAVRRELAEQLPDDVNLDDFVRILQVLKRGYRVGFAPDAISFEPTTASLADEQQRRTTITAGRWYLLTRPSLFPLRRPIVMWQILSHKVGRLMLPLFALFALAVNTVEVAARRRDKRQREAVVVLAAQLSFYVAAIVGPACHFPGRLGRLARLPRYLVATNVATLRGLACAVRGDKKRVWDKVARHEVVTARDRVMTR